MDQQRKEAILALINSVQTKQDNFDEITKKIAPEFNKIAATVIKEGHEEFDNFDEDEDMRRDIRDNARRDSRNSREDDICRRGAENFEYFVMKKFGEDYDVNIEIESNDSLSDGDIYYTAIVGFTDSLGDTFDELKFKIEVANYSSTPEDPSVGYMGDEDYSYSITYDGSSKTENGEPREVSEEEENKHREVADAIIQAFDTEASLDIQKAKDLIDQLY